MQAGERQVGHGRPEQHQVGHVDQARRALAQQHDAEGEGEAGRDREEEVLDQVDEAPAPEAAVVDLGRWVLVDGGRAGHGCRSAR